MKNNILVKSLLFLIPPFFLLCLNPDAFFCDDAYIHFKVAQNQLLGLGPYFDPTDPILVSSSPAWTIFLFVLGKVFTDPISALPWFLIIFQALVLILSLRILRKSNSHLGFLELFITGFAILGAGFLPFRDGMETILATLCMLLALEMYRKENPLCLAFAGLLPFLRPEYVLLSIFLSPLLFRKKFSPLGIPLFLFPVLSILAFLYAYFPGPIPHSIHAKSIIYSPQNLQTLLDLFPGWDSWPILLRLAPYLGMIYFLIKPHQCKGPLLKALVLLAVGIPTTYLARTVFVFSWYGFLYQLPLILLLSLLKDRKTPVFLFALFLAPFLLEGFLGACSIFEESMYRYSLRSARVRSYLKIGGILGDIQGEKKTELMIAEAGAIGMSYPGKILDGAGLIQKEALVYHPLEIGTSRRNGTIGAIPGRYALKKKPGFILGYDLFIEDLVLKGVTKDYWLVPLPLFRKEDRHLNQGNLFWGSKHLVLFIRKDLKLLPGWQKALMEF